MKLASEENNICSLAAYISSFVAKCRPYRKSSLTNGSN